MSNFLPSPSESDLHTLLEKARDTLQSMRPLAPRWWSPYTTHSLQAFVAAWLAGCMLMRSARYVVNEFHDQPMIRTPPSSSVRPSNARLLGSPVQKTASCVRSPRSASWRPKKMACASDPCGKPCVWTPSCCSDPALQIPGNSGNALNALWCMNENSTILNLILVQKDFDSLSLLHNYY